MKEKKEEVDPVFNFGKNIDIICISSVEAKR